MRSQSQRIAKNEPSLVSPSNGEHMAEVRTLRQESVVGTASLPEVTPGAAWDHVLEPAGDIRSHRSAYGRKIAVADAIAIALALVMAVGIILLLGRELNMFRLGVTLVLMLPAWLAIAYVSGLYSLSELRISHGLVDEIGRVVMAATAWSWLLLVSRSLFGAGPTSLTGPVLIWLFSIPTILALRAVYRAWARKRPGSKASIAVIGSIEERLAVCERIQRHPEWGLEIKADFDLDGPLGEDTVHTSELLRRHGVGRVLIAGGPGGLSARTDLVNDLVEQGMLVDVVSGGPESIYSNALLHDMEGLPVLSVRPTRLRPLDLRAKRVFDVVVASVGLLFTWPILLWAAIRIKTDSKGPVFFRQSRCGQDGSEIQILKLRTMVDGADDLREEMRALTEDEGETDVLLKLEEDPRVTNVGRMLRKWSIDELPQLWNVLRGEMSVVGPRPLPFDEAIQATGVFWARTRVKPGLAGPWQAYGRSTIPFDDMIRLDYSYAVGWSMAEDLRLLLRTANAVVSRRGAY